MERWPAPAPCPSRLLPTVARQGQGAVLLSGPGDLQLSRWSYGALEPAGFADGFESAMARVASWVSGPRGAPPWVGGAIGYLGYDAGWCHQAQPRMPRPDPLGLPASAFMLFDAIYAQDRVTGDGFLVSQPFHEAEARLERLKKTLRSPGPVPKGALIQPLAAQVGQRTHEARIRDALALIEAGEAYQVNLSYALEGVFRGAPEAALLRLLQSPVPFLALLRLNPREAILSASPECFFDYDAHDRTIRAYPIKGTRPRAPTRAEDQAQRHALRIDPKERAEHLMIVDLLRNDLGQTGTIGSVAVEALAYLESFPGVHHLTSRIRATLPPDRSLAEVLRALFPGGSITGAPKLRAMEIIDHLEDRARGVYTGAIGYLCPDGSVRTSIAIRTATFNDRQVMMGVGGGIVADSCPAREWEETVAKSAPLRRALLG